MIDLLIRGGQIVDGTGAAPAIGVGAQTRERGLDTGARPGRLARAHGRS